jgi:hypothetical protein
MRESNAHRMQFLGVAAASRCLICCQIPQIAARHHPKRSVAFHQAFIRGAGSCHRADSARAIALLAGFGDRVIVVPN